MPGYKTHLAAGAALYAAVLYVARSLLCPTYITAIEWLLCTLTGSLFPDIDVKSKGQNVGYLLLALLMIVLLARGQVETVAILGVLAMIPMIVQHRGLFHRLWFIGALSAAIVIICMAKTTMSCRMLIIDACFFMLGALSHLWLDMGFAGLFKK